jgi:ParB-like chromosome segregation protein Spo0J
MPVTNQIVSLALCRPHPRNYNKHEPEQIDNLRLSLRRFGQVRSIVVQDDGAGAFLIVAGHGIVLAARAERLTELRADVIPADWPENQVLAYLAADNELARQANPDEAQLALIIAELADAQDDELATLAAGGIDRLEELLDLLEEHDAPEDAGDQTAKADEAQEKWQVRSGDLVDARPSSYPLRRQHAARPGGPADERRQSAACVHRPTIRCELRQQRTG